MTGAVASPEMAGFVQRFDRLVGNVGRVMHGKDQVVQSGDQLRRSPKATS